MTWLITGGCGFVGTNLANAVLERGPDVVLFDNFSRIGSRDNHAWLRERHGSRLRLIEGDIRDTSLVERTITSVHPVAVAHLAGQVAMTTSLSNPRLDFEVNVGGTVNLLEAVRQYSPTTVVLYSSTNKVYGSLDTLRYQEGPSRFVASDFPEGFDERTPLDFHTPYGCSKGAADQYVLDYARMFGLKTAVFRHSSMYGGRQFATVDQGWIGWFCKMALEMRAGRTESIRIAGNGKQVRDVLHAHDLVAVYLSTFDNIEHASGAAYNVGGGVENSLSLLELFAKLESALGVRLSVECGPWRQDDQKVFIANNARLIGATGWRPTVGVDAGLEDMLAWTAEAIDRR